MRADRPEATKSGNVDGRGGSHQPRSCAAVTLVNDDQNGSTNCQAASLVRRLSTASSRTCTPLVTDDQPVPGLGPIQMISSSMDDSVERLSSGQRLRRRRCGLRRSYF
jgi:hypothetical protein